MAVSYEILISAFKSCQSKNDFSMYKISEKIESFEKSVISFLFPQNAKTLLQK